MESWRLPVWHSVAWRTWHSGHSVDFLLWLQHFYERRDHSFLCNPISGFDKSCWKASLTLNLYPSHCALSASPSIIVHCLQVWSLGKRNLFEEEVWVISPSLQDVAGQCAEPSQPLCILDWATRQHHSLGTLSGLHEHNTMGDDEVGGKVLIIKGHVWIRVETKDVDTIVSTEAGHLPFISSLSPSWSLPYQIIPIP